MNECSSSAPRMVEAASTTKKERRMWNHCPWQNVVETKNKKNVTKKDEIIRCLYSAFCKSDALVVGELLIRKTSSQGEQLKIKSRSRFASIFRIAHIPIWWTARMRRFARTSAEWSRWVIKLLWENLHHEESHKNEIRCNNFYSLGVICQFCKLVLISF